jgi:hypothetical protein
MTPMDVEKLAAELLTDELVSKFKANYIAAAGEDRVAKEERRRGAASLLRQMRSVFSPSGQCCCTRISRCRSWTIF